MELKRKYITVFFIIVLLTIFLIGASVKVNATDIVPFASYNPNPVSFYGTYTGTSNYYDGTTMGFQASATASDGISRELIIEVYVFSTNTTHRYRTYTDGVNRGAENIPINNGSNVRISAYCSDASIKVTLKLKMYS